MSPRVFSAHVSCNGIQTRYVTVLLAHFAKCGSFICSHLSGPMLQNLAGDRQPPRQCAVALWANCHRSKNPCGARAAGTGTRHAVLPGTVAPTGLRLCLQVAFLVACLTAGLAGVGAVVDPAERAALVDLYLNTSGPTLWKSRTGWANYTISSVDPCVPTKWFGVACSTLPDHVT